MQVDRMFELLYLLLDRPGVTARELAKRFEVSTRTIYRDVDALSRAGIPIYTAQGRGGGIYLTPGFVLNKSLLTGEERQEILASLQGMRAVGRQGAALDKLAALFGEGEEDWISVEFSSWNPENAANERFEHLRSAILARQVVTFPYSGSRGETMERVVEPIRLVYRGSDWYLLAWCRMRQDFRYFKLNRMGEVTCTDETFLRRVPPVETPKEQAFSVEIVEVLVRIGREMAYRVYDEIPADRRTEEGDHFLVRLHFPENEWLYQYLLTFGAALTVLEPLRVRKEMVYRLRQTLSQYDGPPVDGSEYI